VQAKRAIASFWRIGNDELPLSTCLALGRLYVFSALSAGSKGPENIAQVLYLFSALRPEGP
jgi:hypothetical protein